MSELKQIDFALARVHGYGDLVDEISRLSAELAKALKERDRYKAGLEEQLRQMNFIDLDPVFASTMKRMITLALIG